MYICDVHTSIWHMYLVSAVRFLGVHLLEIWLYALCARAPEPKVTYPVHACHTYIIHCYKWWQKLEFPLSLIIAKAKELAKVLNIEEFKGSWGWMSSFRTWQGLGSTLLYGEGAEVNKEDPILLQSLNELNEIIKKYPPACVCNMDETGLFLRLLLAILCWCLMKIQQQWEARKSQRTELL